MKFGTWLGLAATVCAVGCSSSDKQLAAPPDSKTVAEALTTGLAFKKGLIKKGSIPGETATSVDVTQDDAPLTLAPGGDAIMSLDADNPDEDSDPVEAMLVQFQDSTQHVEVPVTGSSDAGTADGGSGTQHYEAEFSANDTICKDFCQGEFMVVMIQALKLHKGGVTKHVNRNLSLDCRKHGKEACEDTSKSKDKDAGTSGKAGSSGGKAGSSGSSGGSTATPSAVSALASALVNFSKAGCVCANGKATTPYCANAGLDRNSIMCVTQALDDNAKTAGVTTWASCLSKSLGTTYMTACTSCGVGACDASQVMTAAGSCPMLDDKTQTAFDACNITTGPSMDAGAP